MGKYKVDLVMWTYNSEKNLPAVLKRIQEVIPKEAINRKIITDDNSKDKTKQIAQSFGWEVYPNKGKGVNDNTKTAISLVTAPFFCSFEHDIILAPNWWRVISKYMDDPKVAVAQGVRVSTNPAFRMLDDIGNQRDDVPHNSLDNNIARTEVIQKIGYNEAGTPPELEGLGLKWIVDKTVVSDHIRDDMWENIRHDAKMQQTLPSTWHYRLLALRLLLTSPVRSTQLAVKTGCPMLVLLYPLDRLGVFVASLKHGAAKKPKL